MALAARARVLSAFPTAALARAAPAPRRAARAAPFALAPRRAAAAVAAMASGSAAAATGAAPAADVQGSMLEPSTANKPLVRAAALAAAVALAARGSAELSASALGGLHLIAFGTWLGTMVW
jgi:hypothetical protein